MAASSEVNSNPVTDRADVVRLLQTLGPDRELIERLLEGDEQAFGVLVDRYHQAMLRLAQLFVSQRSVAEEVVQDTWLAVIKGLRSFEGRSSLKTWIFRILSNRAKTRGVREGRTVPFSALPRLEGEQEPAVEAHRFTWIGSWKAPVRPWEAETPEKLVLDQESRGQIEAAIQELPDKQRIVVQLRDLEGWSAEEVCNILEISETYQRVLLHRGRSRVRKAIEAIKDKK
ncbi:MAG: sigma-70 family RNA polymerase sigma factor [Bradymonadales bacterium]|nr:sigma-70 family RNA polymerase sigma factor [Bradymonadales bacterium]